MVSRIFPGGFGAPITDVAELDLDDPVLMAKDDVVHPVNPAASRARAFVAANTGAAYTATRTVYTEDFVLTVTANTTITLAGGGVAGVTSVWNVTFVEDATGGRTIAVNGVEWVGGAPSFTAAALVANHCTFTQHGTGTIYGTFRGTSAPTGTPTGLVPPGSIDGTGATNVSAGLQAWIDAQPDGSTFNFTGKTYRCDQTLFLTDRNNLTMVGGTILTDDPTGDGSTLGAPSPAARTRAHWKFMNSTNIVVRNMTVRGPNIGGSWQVGYTQALEAQHGFTIRGCTNVEIDTCTVSDIYGDWFDLTTHDVTGVRSNGIHIHDCTLDYDGRQGLAVPGANNVIFQYNDCQHMTRAFCDLEPNGAINNFGADTVLIDSNTVGFHGLTFIASKGNGPVTNVTVSNNVVTGGNLWIIVEGDGVNGASPRTNWVINNNTSDISLNSGAGCAMEFTNAVNVTVTNNFQDVSGAAVMALAAFQNCVGVVNQGNSTPGATYSMIGASTRVRNCGNRFAATGPFDQPEVCVTDFGTAKQYAGLTGWYDAFQATDVDQTAAPQLTDFSGNGRHLVAAGAAQPTFRTSVSSKNVRCWQFNGISNVVGNTIPASAFFTASAYTAFMVFEATSIDTVGDNDAVWSESNAVAGLYLRDNAGYEAYAYNFDGSADILARPLTLGKRTLIMMRHQGGNLYIAKDGGAEVSIASGNTADLTGLIRIGADWAGAKFSNILLHEVNFYNVALTTPQIADRNARLMSDWNVAFAYGAADTFTRPDGPIGISELGSKPWQKNSHTTWSVVSGKAMLTAPWVASGFNDAWIDCGVSDCTAQVDIDTSLGGALMFRHQDSLNSNFLYNSANHLWLWTAVNSNNIELHHITTVAASGVHQLKVVMNGSSVKSYFDGVLQFDDVITNCQLSTSHGFCVFATTPAACTWDNFLVTA